MNNFFQMMFISFGEYGKVWDKYKIEEFSINLRRTSGVEFNVWDLIKSINRIYHKNKNICGIDLYNSLTNSIIRNYKKWNMGKRVGEWDSIIRDELYWIVRIDEIMNDCETLYKNRGI